MKSRLLLTVSLMAVLVFAAFPALAQEAIVIEIGTDTVIRGFEGETTREDSQVGEQGLFLRLKEFIAPFNRTAQGMLPVWEIFCLANKQI